MLYHVTMQVNLPPDMDPATAERIKAAEKAYAQELQRQGKWVHLWRVAGRYANVSVFDVSSHDELHELLCQLPLYPYLDITVTPLARHPSAIQRGIRNG
jgi:muconolactone D-isomerase